MPEIKFEASDAAKVFYAIGHYQAFGFSPFYIESTEHPEDEPITKSYSILLQLSPEILQDGRLTVWPEGFFDEWDKAIDEMF